MKPEVICLSDMGASTYKHVWCFSTAFKKLSPTADVEENIQTRTKQVFSSKCFSALRRAEFVVSRKKSLWEIKNNKRKWTRAFLLYFCQNEHWAMSYWLLTPAWTYRPLSSIEAAKQGPVDLSRQTTKLNWQNLCLLHLSIETII